MKEKMLYERYEITGLNREYLLNALARRQIPVYYVKKIQKNKVRLTISASSRKKLFAFLDGSCYNVKKVRTFGCGHPFVLLKKRLGIVVGIAIFFAVVMVFSRVMLDVKYVGSGAVYATEIDRALEDGGVKRYSFFSSWDNKEIERKLFALGKFSFVSVSRKGMRLVVRTELTGTPPSILERGQTQMTAVEGGVVVSLKVLRGTPLVKVGDTVKRGDVVVSGAYTAGEEQKEGAVLATLVLSCTAQVVCPLPSSEEEKDAAMIFAKHVVAEFGEITGCNAQEEGGEYVVTITYQRTQFGG